MKQLLLIIASVFLSGTVVSANTTTNSLDNNIHGSTFMYDYGNSFIFVEQGVEFAVFPDGQFDFNVDQYGPNFSAYADLGGLSISFNTGHSYDAYVQYDDYGAVIQIENVPVYYDYYGRIVRAGNVRINYNSYGRINRVGSLYVHYDRYNSYSHYSGYINAYNRNYVYRPWHTYYAAPIIDFCIVLNRPYRQYYNSVRHTYYRPYKNNYRQRVNLNTRRSAVATNKRRSDNYRQSSASRRGDNTVARGRRVASVDQVRTRNRNSNFRETSDRQRPQTRNSKSRVTNRNSEITRPKTVKRSETIRPRTVQSRSKTVKRSVNSKPRTVKRNEKSRPRVSSKSSTRSRVSNTQTKRKTNTVKQRSQRSKSSQAKSRSPERLRQKSRASSSKKPKSRTSKRRN